jgi:two-component system sensor histidine kinase KdpD
MATSFAKVAQGPIAAAMVVFAATLLSLLAHANPVTAGFAYLISVLLLTIWQGFLAGTLGSILATACFNYFFFPPIGTFHVADPQNWVSLGCFLIATMIASRLVSRERERASEAEIRQREIQALYNLCVDLFTAGTTPGGLEAATSRALTTIGAQGGGLVLPSEGTATDSGEAWVGSPKDLEMHRFLRSAASPPPKGAEKRWRNVSNPITIGGHRVGELVAYGTQATRETLESVARLIALALERERLLTERARLEALDQSDSLKTALLQAVSHDLSTPLTAVLVSIESLKRMLAGDPVTSEAIELIATETSRLHRRIQNLLDLARLQAGSARPNREPTPAADLFRSVRESLPYIASTRRVESRVEAGCPDLDVDPSLALEILVNLVENAHRASPAAGAIELVARPHHEDAGRVLVEVLDRGRGFTPPATGHAPRPGNAAAFVPGDIPHKGLGLEIARSFAGALEGTLSLLPREGGGVCARIELPASRLSSAPYAGGI